ncbi:MAG: hypothetical protein N2169_00325 [bacterium]|nr:hypothetical protein [bacterium]
MRRQGRSRKNSENLPKKNIVNYDNIDVENLYLKIKIGSFSDYGWALENYKNFKNISREEELKIIKEAKGGRMEAKIILISLVFPYIIKIYRTLVNAKGDYFDYISEGIAAALEAIQRYDLTKYDVRFSTYAAYWIYHSLVKNTYQDTTVRVPLSIYSEYSKFIRAYNQYVHKYNTKPSLVELVEYIYGDEIKQKIKNENPQLSEKDDIFKKIYNVKMSELKEKYSRISGFMSLKSEISLQEFRFSDSSRTVEEFIENKSYDEPESNLNQRTIKENIIRSIMNFLDDEEKIIILEYYGLLDSNNKTLEQIRDIIFSVFGKKYSKERIRQKLKTANFKLRKLLSKEMEELLREV